MRAVPITGRAPIERLTPADYLSAVRCDLSWRRFAFSVGAALVAATQLLFQPDLLTLWDFVDVMFAFGRYAIELSVLACGLTVAFTAIDHLPLRSRLIRTVVYALAFGATSFQAVLLIGVVEFWPRIGSMPLGLAFAESIRWTLTAGFLAAVFLLHRHGLFATRLANELEETQEALRREQAGMQLRLLQAQIEPHFLFNTLANMRRLYRTRPEEGVHMVESLLRYLRAALPQLRQSVTTLGDELDLVHAYLELVRIRMGDRLRYSIRSQPELATLPFPPMLLMTLVENAVKHGLEPAAPGGRIDISASRVGELLAVTVADDGVGLGGAQTGGTGVGLANIRRQLALRFGGQGSLAIEARAPSGVVCLLQMPIASANAAEPARVFAAAA